MKDFTFTCPTKIIFGKNSVLKLGDEILARGFKNVLIIYGSKRIEENGLINTIISQISPANPHYFVLSGIRENPEISKVKEGLEIVKNNNIDCLIAIGGGSVIDCAKLISVAAFYEGDPFDFNRHLVKPIKSLPIIAVLTISSAGSELSNSCVIQNDELKIKSGFNSDLIRPIVAIEDPFYTVTVDKFHTAVGIADSIMHSLERLCNKSSDSDIADDFAIDVIKKIMKYGEIVLKDPLNLEARGVLMICSSLSHNGITSIGKESIFNVHPIEHGLSGYKKDVIHGAGVALIYPAWAEYVYEQDIDKFALITEKIFDKKYKNKKETAIMGIALFRDYFSKLGLPTTLRDVGLTREDISPIANLVTDNGTRVIGRYPKSLNRDDVEKILLKLI